MNSEADFKIDARNVRLNLKQRYPKEFARICKFDLISCTVMFPLSIIISNYLLKTVFTGRAWERKM